MPRRLTASTGANVNFASEKLTFSFDPAVVEPKVALQDVIDRVAARGL